MNTLYQKGIKEKKTLVFGSSGFFGSYFDFELSNQFSEQKGDGTATLDFYRFESENDIVKYVENYRPSYIVNCIALADIDRCEKEIDLGIWLNRDLPKILAKVALKHGIKMAHISTDAVFGDSVPFRTEEHRPSPTSNYGKYKLEGEQAVTQENGNALIARVNIVGKNPKGKSLSDFFYKKFIAKQEIFGVRDIFFTPIFARSGANIVIELLELNQNGIFHVVGSTRLSKLDFGLQFLDLFVDDKPKITPKYAHELPSLKSRTLELSLSNNKIQKLNIKVPTLKEDLFSLYEEYHDDNYKFNS